MEAVQGVSGRASPQSLKEKDKLQHPVDIEWVVQKTDPYTVDEQDATGSANPQMLRMFYSSESLEETDKIQHPGDTQWIDLNIDQNSLSYQLPTADVQGATGKASLQTPGLLSSSKSLAEMGKLLHPDGIQWIGRNTDSNSLPYSAVFRCGGIIKKLHGYEHLFTAGADYCCKASVDPIVELDNSTDLEEAIRILEAHIKLAPMNLSSNHVACDRAAHYFEECLTSISSKALECRDRADALLQMCRFMKEHHYELSGPFVPVTNGNQYYTTVFNAAIDYFEAKTYLKRSEIRLNAEQFPDSEDKFIKNALRKVMDNYKDQLMARRESTFTRKIAKIKDERIFIITLADIELFSDLEQIMTKEQFKEPLEIIRGNLLMIITDPLETNITRSSNMSNGMYYFVLKSLMEVSTKLSELLRLIEVVTYGRDKWAVVDLPKGHEQSLLENILRQQLRMLVMLANHYEPGTKTVHQRIPYHFKYVKIENPLQDDVYTCLCILDDTLKLILPENIQASSLISGLQSLTIFKDHNSSGNSTNVATDSLYLVMPDVLDLLVHAFTVINNTANPNNALEILTKQVSILNRGVIELRKYLNVFITFWRLCNNAFQHFSCSLPVDNFKQPISVIQTRLLRIISLVLDNNEDLPQLMDFLEKYEDFLKDLSTVDLKWYIRHQGKRILTILVDKNAMELVNNKWRGTEHQCYIVKSDAIDTITNYIDLSGEKHYQLSVLEHFLEYIYRLTEKCTNERNLLNALLQFIVTIRNRLPHFERQPDYIDFETFFSENVEPFRAAVENNVPLEEFKKRTLRITESFRCIRKTNSIDIDKALKLLLERDSKINAEILKLAYTTYQKHFEAHIVEDSSLNYNERITQILKSIQPKAPPSWSEEFKQSNLPEILAGLAAAWSMIASQDIASRKTYLIPHTVQILCILRLLSVDQPGVGVANHFAQVLSGQGKSMILGLTAALLAWFGYNVSVICYNRYLAERDAVSFQELFQLLNVSNRISYDTINNMLDHHSTAHTGRNGDSTLVNMGLPKKIMSKPNQNEAVLLVDETDALHADKIFGNMRIQTIRPLIVGLDVVQLNIWQSIQAGDTNCSGIMVKIYRFISTSKDPRVINLKTFIELPQKYSILIQGREGLVESVVTNRTLFSKHLHVMIQSALKVHRQPINGSFFSKYKLDKEGRITCQNRFGEFTPSCAKGYYNTFVYFKLKGNNFVQNVRRCNNYGYFIITVGKHSYVQLLANYPLTLGVTGHLATLDKSGMHHCRIQKVSFMPSSFGSTLLKFDKAKDFKCISTEMHWMRIVINQINTIIKAERSVLVFFDTEANLSKFKQKIGSQLRLIVLTDAIESKEQFINDVGLENTITLATREMGRGVDFKVGATVEKNGGLHVIQTFFSLDVKEEMQIKGRTARQNQRGSYEQIVCFEHLVNLQLIGSNAKSDVVCYDHLDSARRIMANKSNEVMAKQPATMNVKNVAKFHSSATK